MVHIGFIAVPDLGAKVVLGANSGGVEMVGKVRGQKSW